MPIIGEGAIFGSIQREGMPIHIVRFDLKPPIAFNPAFSHRISIENPSVSLKPSIDVKHLFHIGDGVVRAIECRTNPDDFIVDICNLLRGQGCIPNLHLINYTREMRVPCTIDSEFVDFNTVYSPIGYALVENLYSV